MMELNYKERMINLLSEAKDEIHMLRRSNEILSAKQEMVDLFALVLHTKPNLRSQGYGEDVTWKLDEAIDALGAES